jgi:hypothetical protein
MRTTIIVVVIIAVLAALYYFFVKKDAAGIKIGINSRNTADVGPGSQST